MGAHWKGASNSGDFGDARVCNVGRLRRPRCGEACDESFAPPRGELDHMHKGREKGKMRVVTGVGKSGKRRRCSTAVRKI
jgi:hypothetical protein